MSKPFKGVVNVDIRDSKPDWEPFEPPKAPDGAPSVVYIVLDDVGFSALGCYGGPVETPNIDRIAADGVRYTQWHTTALCSPTRSCLLTGRNHTRNSMACITEAAIGFPNASGTVPPENGTISEILGELGWNTYMVGKWHLCPDDEMNLASTRRNWPSGRGFERWYGFLGAETSQWYPELVYDNHTVDQPRTPEEGYHLTEDLTDKAIEFIQDSKAIAPEKPFFMYYCPGAAHAPHMPSHIFVSMGMWDETVHATVFALGPDGCRYTANHYSAWLDYAYLQQGRVAAARDLLETARRNLGSPPKGYFLGSLLGMRAHYLVASERWTDSSTAWPMDTTGWPVAQAMDAFALGYAALHRKDRAEVEAQQRRLGALAARKPNPEEDDGDLQIAAVLEKELRAATRAADGAGDEAVALLRDAATVEEAIPPAFGPPDVVKPAPELLGEVLLAQGKAADAQQAFARALALAPRRSLSLLGLARAATAAGDTVVADQAYADLRGIWRHADADVSGVAEVARPSARAR